MGPAMGPGGLRAAALALGFLAGLSAPAAAASREAVATVDKVQAEAAAVYQQGSRALAGRSEILFRDQVTTGPGARLQATFRDGTQLTLGEDAALEINEFVYDPDRSAGRMALQVVQGAFIFVGGQVEAQRGASVEIETPVATLGVRGTTVWGGAIDDGFGVLVLDGRVDVTTPAGAVTLSEGQGTMIYGAGQAPAAPVIWPQQKVERAIETISFR